MFRRNFYYVVGDENEEVFYSGFNPGDSSGNGFNPFGGGNGPSDNGFNPGGGNGFGSEVPSDEGNGSGQNGGSQQPVGESEEIEEL